MGRMGKGLKYQKGLKNWLTFYLITDFSEWGRSKYYIKSIKALSSSLLKHL